jgi:hypothetical protein
MCPPDSELAFYEKALKISRMESLIGEWGKIISETFRKFFHYTPKRFGCQGFSESLAMTMSISGSLRGW